MPKTKAAKKKEHFVIPDTQVRPGVNTGHLEAAGNYIAERRPDVIVHLGDHWDFPSLSSYDSVAKKTYDEVDFYEDIEAGNEAMERLLKPIRRKRSYKPRMVFCFGNHENRRVRYVEEHPEARRSLSDDRLNLGAFERHAYQKPVEIDGVLYAHFFCRNSKGRIINTRNGQASAAAQSKNVGQSSTAGHRQGLEVDIKETDAGRIRSIICGSYYSHEESYLGPQGTHYWRGCLYKHEVHKGNYDLLELSLDYLVEKWL